MLSPYVLFAITFVLLTGSGSANNAYNLQHLLKTANHLLQNAGNSMDEDTKSHGLSDTACKNPFEGFGVHLGAILHLQKAKNPQLLIEEVADKLYNDLRLRRFRTSYESSFSPSEDVYDISCRDIFSCTWNLMHRAMAKYRDATYMASIWGPPKYMKNAAEGLKNKYEWKYYQYIKNVTQLIKSTFNQTIELVSLVNEPENIIAPWEHCNMGPHQICKMVEAFNDPLVSACTENSWFSVTNAYMDYNSSGVSCRKACKTILTHAYAVNFNTASPDFLSASYDSGEYRSKFEQPIWQTEVSSTYGNAASNQMTEGLSLAKNIIQFVGTTCVTRYYFWSAFTFGSSGESLIWGDEKDQKLTFPKKYFVYRHFTVANYEHPNSKIKRCDLSVLTGLCLQFDSVNGEQSTSVFINERANAAVLNLKNCDVICCTTEGVGKDHFCGYEKDAMIPPLSVCSCKITNTNTGGSNNAHLTLKQSFTVLITSIFLSFSIRL